MIHDIITLLGIAFWIWLAIVICCWLFAIIGGIVMLGKAIIEPFTYKFGGK